jgi:hypothetical protein
LLLFISCAFMCSFMFWRLLKVLPQNEHKRL